MTAGEDPTAPHILTGLHLAAESVGYDEAEAERLATKLDPHVPRSLNVAETWLLGVFLRGMAEVQHAATESKHESMLLTPVETGV